MEDDDDQFYRFFLGNTSDKATELENIGNHDDAEFLIPDAHGQSRKRKRSQTRPAPQPLISQEQRYWTAIAEPPDINYWRILCEDEQFKEAVVKYHVMHFEERCLRYETHIFDLEACLLADYKAWCFLEKRAQAKRDGEVDFYALLAMELDYFEHGVVHEQYVISVEAIHKNRRRRARRVQDNKKVVVPLSVSESEEGLDTDSESFTSPNGNASMEEMYIMDDFEQ